MSIIGRTAAPLGSFKAWITVNANRSATFSISPAAKKIVSQTETQIVYLISEVGDYTVSATDGTYSRSSTVSITAKKQSEVVDFALFDLSITLVAGGSTYNFTRASGSSSSGNYNYSKNGENWQLLIYSGGSIKFNTLQTNVDLCVVGGGGGGGGGSSGGSGYWTCHGRDGGRGGGGTVNTQTNKSLTVGSSYTTTIGGGGSGGLGGDNGSGRAGANGSNGGTSVLGGYTAAGGAGGQSGWDSGDRTGSDGNTNSPQSVFGITVGGAGAGAEGVRGGGGKRGSWVRADAPSSTSGGNGAAGIIIIRNAR